MVQSSNHATKYVSCLLIKNIFYPHPYAASTTQEKWTWQVPYPLIKTWFPPHPPNALTHSV